MLRVTKLTAIAATVVMLTSSWAAASPRERDRLSVARLLHGGAFGSRLPTRSDLAKRWGEGMTKKPYPDELLQIYYDAKSATWIQFKIEGGVKVGYVSEILLSAVPLSSKHVASNHILQRIDLCGFRLGDSCANINQLGEEIKIDSVLLGNTQVERHRFRAPSERGTVRTVFCRGNRLVGFAISSPE
jgi:hypothetical protein